MIRRVGSTRGGSTIAAVAGSAATRWVALVLLGISLAMVTWPFNHLVPVNTIDGSWQAGLAMAQQRGYRWGVDVVFTYGPLGFMDWPQLVVPRLGAIAFVVVASAHLALLLVVAWLSLRNESLAVGLPIALVGALLAARVMPTTAFLLTALAVSMDMLRRDARSPLAPRIAAPVVALLGVLGALVVLVKLNDGGTLLLVGLATALALQARRRTVPAFALGAGGGIVLLWLVAGQQLPDLIAYVATGIQIATGYSTAMGLDDSGRAWEYGAVIVVAVLAAWCVWRVTTSWPLSTRAAAVATVGIAGFLAYKQAFVRHGGAAFFEFAAVLIVWILPWRRFDRERRLLVLAAITIAALGTSAVGPLERINPAGIAVALDRGATLVSTPARIAAINDARARLRDEYAIPASMLSAMRGGTVHVEPYQTLVLWAYPELSWRPLPIMQPYSAYTSELDGLNAAELASTSGPGFILHGLPMSIDWRQPFYESPRATLEEVCRYTQIVANLRWQLLRRGPSRCGAAKVIKTIDVSPGEEIQVPPEASDDRLLVAHIDGVDAGPIAALQSVLYKSPAWWIRLGDGGTFRLVPETASGPLILSVPSSLGWDAAFRPPTGIGSFAVGLGTRAGMAESQPDGQLTITFENIPFD